MSESTWVTDKKTKMQMLYSLPPDQAVVAAYEYSRGNVQTWNYPKPKDHPKFKSNSRSCRCGNWVAERS